MLVVVCNVPASTVAASTFAASEHLLLCDEACVIPACRWSLVMVCWSITGPVQLLALLLVTGF
ncbi:hypothetical protein HX878_20805 [Pseudomonas veronii]|jgi:hypothetical protein|uniref:hypothetical protein n=1 Tax=Pseudomonas veronii TaxID=76761 RepID=UPI001799D7C2|nr:hypothetical protein [Pseudomonas veronii]NWD57175.1 hypothetical protein [Pseudomonas veronii]